ncbi:MAG: zinc-dependent alcohol dehydrogenase [Spirochaetota bacterium]
MDRRLVASAPHVIEVESFEVPEPGPDQLVIRAEFASGKHGTARALFDKVNFQGQEFDQATRLFTPASEGAGWGAFSAPLMLGTTVVGVVEAAGPEVSTFTVGDRVVALGKVATRNVVDAGRAWLLGEADPLEALCIEPAYVSIHSVREGGVRFGETVAVIGLGAIGLIAVEMAYRSGARTVIAADPLANRREWARAHGAAAVLDPTADDVPRVVHELTGGRGADVVIEASGSYQALESAIKCTRMRGTVCAAGFYQGEATSLWLGREFHHNRLTMIVPHGCGWGHEPRDYPRWDESRAYETIVGMLRDRRIDLSGLITPLVSVEEMPGVFERIENDPGSVIKYGVRF